MFFVFQFKKVKGTNFLYLMKKMCLKLTFKIRIKESLTSLTSEPNFFINGSDELLRLFFIIAPSMCGIYIKTKSLSFSKNKKIEIFI